MPDTHADFMVVGGGPEGHACALRAADLGRDVVPADPRATLGGASLNEGGILSRAVLHVAELLHEARHDNDWGMSTGRVPGDLVRLRGKKDEIVACLTGGPNGLAQRRKVRVIRGPASFTGAASVDIDGKGWTFKQAVIAVGSFPVKLEGWSRDHRVWDLTDALELRDVPKRLAIVVGGIVGLELATVYTALGSKVTVIECVDQIAPGADAEVVRILRAALGAAGLTVHTGTKVVSVNAGGPALLLRYEEDFVGEIKAGAAIRAVGRTAGELLGECVLPMEMRVTSGDIARSIHADPILSETVGFAAERALGTLTGL
ncbi:pyridine nucleotide-disulfide oxidoreductase [Rhodovulum imhoffii]|uniref:Pyridine nucleotide-disulfide oxidoreductase n=1 Tax=Rhodovulum imhoffii TaxID=365340 RepID=A0A2T5BPR1_9RHOB|nr:FAD-dependent oxidoreductase [Rhodovulum imhoffii]MBK5933575.1 hypothetical protein [Rhodovulum imhoffii]PTN01014.1 pyridine nucleotide-disulfide oxidoreductase [Rhodovulum imhoffii]